MAKGFIILENGYHFSPRWTGYDMIIEIAIKELRDFESGSELAEWLMSRVPDRTGQRVFQFKSSFNN